jgi:hypothetical protein
MILEIALLLKTRKIEEIPRITSEDPTAIFTEDEALLSLANHEGPGPKLVVEPRLSLRDSEAPANELVRFLQKQGERVLVVTRHAARLCQHAVAQEEKQTGRLRVHLLQSRGRPFTITLIDGKIVAFHIHEEKRPYIHHDVI